MTHPYTKEEKKRHLSQRQKIVNLLKEAGEEGVTSLELVKVALRYGARLTELYRKGYQIDKIPLENGAFKYVLRKEPGDIKLFKNATEEILSEVDQHFAKELKTLLESKNFHIVRRNGWWQNGGKANGQQ